MRMYIHRLGVHVSKEFGFSKGYSKVWDVKFIKVGFLTLEWWL
jgi:hypothetical protein